MILSWKWKVDITLEILSYALPKQTMKGKNLCNSLNICTEKLLDKNWKSSTHEKERIPKGLEWILQKVTYLMVKHNKAFSIIIKR